MIAHTRRVLHRMLLRKALFALQGSRVYFHPMADVIAAGQAGGLGLREEHKEGGFSLLVFEKR
jgi:hypothetical protein